MRDPFKARASGSFGRLVRWEGHDIVELSSKELFLRVSLTRGAEILELRDKRKNLDLLWHNNDDIVRNRQYTSSRNSQFGNFLEHFSGGWQEVMPAAQYPVDYKGAPIGGHGEVATLSWNFEVIRDEESVLEVKFWVDLRLLPIRLIRVMTLRGELLRMDESAENLGEVPLEIQWGHHLALGGPIACEGSELLVDEGEPFEVPHYPGPTYRFEVDQKGFWPTATLSDGTSTDLRRLPANDGSDGHIILGKMKRASVGIRNNALGMEAEVTWDNATFPYCWIWMVWGGIKQYPLWGAHRIITIEPFSSPVISLKDAIDRKEIILIPPGNRVETWVEMRVKELAKA